MRQLRIRFVLSVTIIVSVVYNVLGQTTVPEILTNSTLNEQMDYIQKRTRIYENYRAIREDMFQKIVENSLDSLSAAKSKIIGLNNIITELNDTIDILKASLTETKDNLEEVTMTKNSIKLLGMEVNKMTYNTIMWLIIIALIVLLVLGFLVFKRNLYVTTNTKKEYEDLKVEFEEYRVSAREAREKMSMAHFNELKKLKGL